MYQVLCYVTRLLVICLHKVKSSERLFRRLFALFPFMIKSFSSRQRLHFREPALHEGTRLTIDHFMSYERFAYTMNKLNLSVSRLMIA